MNTAVTIYSPAKFPQNKYERSQAVFLRANGACLSTDKTLECTYIKDRIPQTAAFDLKDAVVEKAKFYHVGQKQNRPEAKSIASSFYSSSLFRG